MSADLIKDEKRHFKGGPFRGWERVQFRLIAGALDGVNPSDV